MSGKITSVLLMATIVLFASCDNNSGTAPTTYKRVDLNVPTNVADQFQQAKQNQQRATTNPGNVTTMPVTAQPITNVAAAGLNPEHGKPGHRCDIAVGAPLNSPAPATTPTINATTAKNNPVTITPSQPVTLTTPTTSKAGLNPEHGKPGHRCDIAVGAPLDSKPIATPVVTTTPANNTPVTSSSIPQVTPVLPAADPSAIVAKTNGVTAPGMNPEHGKPGHRCDIAVGAPLDSKPVATPAVEKKN